MWSTGEGNGKPLQYSCFENPMNSMKRQDSLPAINREAASIIVALFSIEPSQYRNIPERSKRQQAWVHPQSCQTLCDLIDCSPPSPQTVAHQEIPGPWDFPGKNTGVGCHFLLQGIFLTQGSNSHLLLSCTGRQILYCCTTREALTKEAWQRTIQVIKFVNLSISTVKFYCNVSFQFILQPQISHELHDQLYLY